MEDLEWRKSSRSGANGGDCVEVALLAHRIVARDSKNPSGGVLLFSPTAWRLLITEIKAGELDL